MNSEKVSIVLPTYNGSKYIRTSLESCLNQTYQNIELIIVDDSSTDQTPQIIQSYKDRRIQYVRHETNKGLPESLNTGFALASGDYLTWTSDDNFYTHDAIEKMLAFLKEKHGSFVYCDYYRFTDETAADPKRVQLDETCNLANSNYIGACFLYSKTVKETVGAYDPETRLAEDYDYWLRVSQSFPLCHLNEALYFYREHEKSLFSSKYYEVKSADLLVRLKNEVLDVAQVTEEFLILIAPQRFGLQKLSMFVARCLFAKRIYRILDAFYHKQIPFEQAKLQLKEVLRIRIVTRKILSHLQL